LALIDLFKSISVLGQVADKRLFRSIEELRQAAAQERFADYTSM
jgi:hypothetical protein